MGIDHDLAESLPNDESYLDSVSSFIHLRTFSALEERTPRPSGRCNIGFDNA